MAKLVIQTKGLPVETLELKDGINRLGRSSDNDFKIQHDTISRFHCEVDVFVDSMWVKDLDSSNGTFVNEAPVEEKVQLAEGDKLRIGDVTMEVQGAPEPQADDLPPPCSNHPEIAATMVCLQCQRTFCGACIHVLCRSGGKVLRLCPACSGHCESLEGMNQGRGQKNLFGFVKKLFKKPPTRQYLD